MLPRGRVPGAPPESSREKHTVGPASPSQTQLGGAVLPQRPPRIHPMQTPDCKSSSFSFSFTKCMELNARSGAGRVPLPQHRGNGLFSGHWEEPAFSSSHRPARRASFPPCIKPHSLWNALPTLNESQSPGHLAAILSCLPAQSQRELLQSTPDASLPAEASSHIPMRTFLVKPGYYSGQCDIHSDALLGTSIK